MEAEFRRQRVTDVCLNSKKMWRFCTLNQNYAFCSTYPSVLVVPHSMSDMVRATRLRSCLGAPALHPSLTHAAHCHTRRCNVSVASEVASESLHSPGSTLETTPRCGEAASPWYGMSSIGTSMPHALAKHVSWS